MILLKALALSIFILSIIITILCGSLGINYADKGDEDGVKAAFICMILPILNIIFIIVCWYYY